MKTAIKNLVKTLTRYSLSSILNITGLAVAFAAFLVMLMQLKHEQTFDTMHEKADRIFRIDRMRAEEDTFGAVVPRGIIDAVLASSPHIEEGVLLTLGSGPLYLTLSTEEGEKGFRELTTTCYPTITKVFDFDMVEGDPNCLESPEKILIPLSMARRMFGNRSAIGEQLHTEEEIWMKGEVKNFTIGGVYRDFPENTQLNNIIYMSIDKTGMDDFTTQNSVAYLVLDSPASRRTVEDNFNATFDFVGHHNGEDTRLRLTPLRDIYYMPGQLTDFFKTGDPNTSRQLLLIAILVIVIACINFVNFSTSLAPVRMKSINTQKVLGSSVASLRRTLVLEAVGISVIAFILACFIVWMLGKMELLSFLIADISLASHLELLAITLLLVVLLGLAAGLYPAWYMTSFPPALVLKGSFGLSPSGRKLRTVLIGVQYVISIILIIAAMNVQMQNNYIRNFDTGFRKNNIAIVNIGRAMYEKSSELYRQKLRDYSGIEDVAFSESPIGSSDTYSQFGMKYGGNEFYPWVIYASPNLPKLLGLSIVEGRDFLESDKQQDNKHWTFLYSRNLKNQVDLPSGVHLDKSWFGEGYVAGFFNDIKLSSLRKGEDYTALAIMPGRNLPVSYIRLNENADLAASVEHIRKTIADIDPAYPFSIEFFDTFHEQLYKKEESLNRMITVFSMLAIILSIAGVLGLVIFETQYRQKEIGVRKVFGATVGSILVKFNTIYFRIIVVCFVFAAPVAYYFISRWLESFVYRTAIHWWIFALAFVVISAITFLTVSFQNWKAATANPIDSIKSE